MKKIGLAILAVVVIASLGVGVAFAVPPSKVIEKAQGVGAGSGDGQVVAPPQDLPFPQPPERELTKILFVRYAPGKGWGPGGNPNKGRDDDEGPTTTCYGFLAGSKPSWNWVEDYYYDSSLKDVSEWAVSTWEAATSGDIFGDGRVGISLEWGVYDQVNSITLGNYENPDVLGVTSIWYRGKNIYEYDIMLDTDYFPVGLYDLDTVMLHEFGHGAGLGDLYDAACAEQVMFYRLGTDDVKQALQDGDKAGIQILYGP